MGGRTGGIITTARLSHNNFPLIDLHVEWDQYTTCQIQVVVLIDGLIYCDFSFIVSFIVISELLGEWGFATILPDIWN